MSGVRVLSVNQFRLAPSGFITTGGSQCGSIGITLGGLVAFPAWIARSPDVLRAFRDRRQRFLSIPVKMNGDSGDRERRFRSW
jgi:hypothetical protein